MFDACPIEVHPQLWPGCQASPTIDNSFQPSLDAQENRSRRKELSLVKKMIAALHSEISVLFGQIRDQSFGTFLRLK
jgi:hypothetical protein